MKKDISINKKRGFILFLSMFSLFMALMLLIGIFSIGRPVQGTVEAAEATRLEELRVAIFPFATMDFTPVDIANSGIPGDERLFIVEQNGRIRVVEPDGTVRPTPFLDIIDQVFGGFEPGLLGLVFDLDYENNGYFYVYYTHETSNLTLISRLSRFSVSADPNVSDPNSEFILFTVDQPYQTHNGGDLNFGPDGYLYLGLGDGGNIGDPGNRAQNPQTHLGKMLRIDVSGTTSTTNYLIPPDNPFVGDPTTLDEIWALGLRNPWRFSFDALTGDMYIGDVGQSLWEEIDFQPASSNGGENWGWRCYEGDEEYNTAGCGPRTQYDFPVATYFHSGQTGGCAVAGGYVYRGSNYPGMTGLYFFADFCFGRIWAMDPANNWQVEELDQFSNVLFTTFGVDIDDELYIASRETNIVYRIVEAELLFLPMIQSPG